MLLVPRLCVANVRDPGSHSTSMISIASQSMLQAQDAAGEWRDTSAAKLLDKWMAGSPVGETVRELLHALEPQPPRDAAQHAADTAQQETGAKLQHDETGRAGSAPQAEDMPQRDYRAAHWKQAMMQHKKAWRPEEWWNDARKRAHGHDEQQRGSWKADRRREEAASWRAAASAYPEASAAQPQTAPAQLHVDGDTQQLKVDAEVRDNTSRRVASAGSAHVLRAGQTADGSGAGTVSQSSHTVRT